MTTAPKAQPDDHAGRWREIISDPLNILIERTHDAGLIDSNSNVILHNNVRVPISGKYAYYNAFSAILLINRGVHEPLEEFVFQEVLKVLGDDPTMLELGAYWGHYSMWLQKQIPSANLHLVEPETINIEAGKHNFELNNCSGSFTQAFVGKGQFNVTSYMESQKIDNLSILHSDIQGFEVEMLTDAKPMLEQQRIDRLFVSTHSDELHYQCKEIIESCGYTVEITSDPGVETTSFDGFIYASAKETPRLFDDFEPMRRIDINTATANDLRGFLNSVNLG